MKRFCLAAAIAVTIVSPALARQSAPGGEVTGVHRINAHPHRMTPARRWRISVHRSAGDASSGDMNSAEASTADPHGDATASGEASPLIAIAMKRGLTSQTVRYDRGPDGLGDDVSTFGFSRRF